MRKFTLRFTLTILILQLILPWFDPTSVAAASTKTLYYNYEQGQFTESLVEVQYSASSTKSINKDIGSFISGAITIVKVTHNGSELACSSCFSGSVINLPSIPGSKITVYGLSETLPGHQIYRQPPGKIWEHKGEKTPAIEFDGMAGSPSLHPGLIPTQGRLRYTTTAFDYRTPGGASNGPDLRYAYDSAQYTQSGQSGSAASGDVVKDFGKEGWAVTTAYEVVRPDKWYVVESNANILGSNANITDGDKIVQSSVEIYGADKHPNAPAIPLSYGKGAAPGQGMIRTMLKLDNTVSRAFYHDLDHITGGQTPPHGLLRNYYMYAIGKWKGDTYQYQTRIDVTYNAPTFPDLAAISITIDNACIEAGQTVTVKYSYRNIGPSTSTPFKVQVRADGVIVHTEIASGGASNGVHLGGQFSYKFNSTVSKTLSVHVDPDNAVNEPSGTRSNNSISKTFTPVASCSSGGGETGGNLTGTVKADKSYIPWRSNNLVSVRVNDTSAACKGDKFRVVVSDTHGTTVEYGPLLDIGKNGSPAGEGWFMFFFDNGTQSYLAGGILHGQITVRAYVLDTCGGWSDIGQDTFTVGEPPPILPPNVQFKWFKNDFSREISRAVIDDSVGLKITKMEDPQGLPIIYEWDFSGSSDWVSHIPIAKGLTSPIRFHQLNNIHADELGSHPVCIRASNGERSTTWCETLQVVPPNPVPVIKGGTSVKENRLLTPPLDTSESYSPVDGRTIDHTRDEKTGLWASSYSVPGDYTLTLHVYDNTGLKSLQPAVHKLNVYPDEIPIAALDYVPTTIRGNSHTFRNTSYSLDGDMIVKYKVWQGYDEHNNGTCSGYKEVSASNTGFTFTPDKVGIYCFQVYTEEDYGKNNTAIFKVEVLNDAPDASFSVKGKNTIPVQPTVKTIKGADVTAFSISTLDAPSTPNHYIANAAGNILAMPGHSCTYGDVVAMNNSLGNVGRYYCPPEKLYRFSNKTLAEQYPQYLVTSSHSIPYPFNSTELTRGGEAIPIFDDLIVFLGSKKESVTDNHDTDRYWNDYYYWRECEVWNTAGRIATCRYSETDNGPSDENDYWTDSVFYINPATNNYAVEYVSYDEGSPDRYRYTLTTYNRNHQVTATRSCQIEGQTRSSGCESYSFDGYSLQRWVTGGMNPGPDVYYFSVGGMVSSKPGPFNYRLDKPLLSKDGMHVSKRTETFRSTPDNEGNSYNYTAQGLAAQQQDYGPISLRTQVPYSGTLETNIMGKLGNNLLFFYYYSYYGPQRATLMSSNGTTRNNVCTMPNLYGDFALQIGESYKAPSEPNKLYVHFSTTHRNDYGDDEYGPWVRKKGESWFEISLNPSGGLDCRSISSIPDHAVIEGYYAPVPGHREFGGALVDPTFDQQPLPGVKVFPGGLIYENGYLTKVVLTSYQPPLSNEIQINGLTKALGQVTTLDKAKNIGLKTSIRFYGGANPNSPAGLSFRIQDHQNMYRAEIDETELRLFKIVNGRKTLLEAKPIHINGNAWTDLKIRALGNQIKVYVNNLPLIILNEDTFLSAGGYGPFTEVAYTEFKTIIAEIYPDIADEDTLGIVLVDEPAEYETTVSDPENDPIAAPLTEWTIQHTNSSMFLDAGDGKSGLEPAYTSNTAKPVFPKTGQYRIGYKVIDDPQTDHLYPDLAFHPYRKWSPVYYSDITVHRKPIARLSLYLSPDGTVGQTDASYDPDRCYADLNCQSGYTQNKGIYEKKMYYISPTGISNPSPLTKPTESGVYEVFLTVKDEHGAWSEWTSATIEIIDPVVNNPPTAQLTFPAGTQAAPSYVSLRPTLSWDQADPDVSTYFTAFEISVKDQWGNCVECVVHPFYTSSGSWSWTLDTELLPGGLYQVQVRVWDDGGKESPWSNVGWMVTNRPPTATMTIPSGTQASPTVFSTLKPIFQWSQSDPDPGTRFTYYQIQVTNEANTSMLWDSDWSGGTQCQLWSGVVCAGVESSIGDYAMPSDLPAGQKLRARVRVSDGFMWSDWSPQTWLYINRPPIATFDWSPKPVWEGDIVSLVNESADPDGDPLSYSWVIRRPDSSEWISSSTHVTGVFDQIGYYAVTLTASDGKAVHSLTRTIPVAPLTITSDVRHTEHWLEYHTNKGHQTTTHPKDFYSGEIWLVETRSSPAPVAEARAWLDATWQDGGNLYVMQILNPSGDPNVYSGELFDEKLLSMTEGLPEGEHLIHFQIHYRNGVIKRESIPVRIIDSVHKSVGVHRVQ